MIQSSDIEKLGRLARLQLSPEEQEKYAQQINSVLDYVHQLDEIDTTDVEPTTHLFPDCNAFREDVSEDRLDQAEVLANAPEKEGAYFKTPQILD